MKKSKILTGALILALGAFLTKILGALYRVPLTAYLKADGLGLYQMAFPAYSLLLDFSSAGVPNALAKKVSENPNNANDYLFSAFKSFGLISVVSAIILAVFCKPLAIFCGDINAYPAFLFLAPAVLIVAFIACFRGYFQGKMLTFPTAISQFLEQSFKFIAGVFLLKRLYTVKSKLAGATIAVFIGEVFALSFLAVTFIIKNKGERISLFRYKTDKNLVKALFKITFPITVLTSIFPLTQIIDSAIIIKGLKNINANGVALYGLFSGVALTVVNLPVSLCYGLSAVAVPAISGGKDKSKTTGLIITTTFLVSLAFAFLAFLFAPLGIKIIFPSLSVQNQRLAINLIRALTPYIVFASLLQSVNATLIANGKTFISVISCVIAVTIKVVLEVILFFVFKFNIYGAVIALNLCYFVACFLNLLYIKIYGNKATQSRQLNNQKQSIFSANGRVYRLRVPLNLRKFRRRRNFY